MKQPKSGKSNKAPGCPECGSFEVVPVVYGSSSPKIRDAVARGRAILADCADWEGRPEWHCRRCGCEWRGEWRRFKKPTSDGDA